MQERLWLAGPSFQIHLRVDRQVRLAESRREVPPGGGERERPNMVATVCLWVDCRVGKARLRARTTARGNGAAACGRLGDRAITGGRAAMATWAITLDDVRGESPAVTWLLRSSCVYALDGFASGVAAMILSHGHADGALVHLTPVPDDDLCRLARWWRRIDVL